MSYVELVPDTREHPRCKATARSGERCKLPPVRGALVCKSHGGHAPQVLRKAQQRVALAEALKYGERRHPWAVLLDTVHAADVLMRDVRMKLEEGGSDLTPQDLTRFVESVERAARLARMTIDARALEFMAQHQRAEAETVARVLNAALAAVSLEPEQEAAMRAAMRRELLAIDGGGRPAIAGA